MSRLVVLAGLALALALGFVNVASAQRGESLDVVTRFRGQSLKIGADLLMPPDHGSPVPAMIILHGSGGINARREYAYADEFLKLGIASIVVDSFSPRGVKSTVEEQTQVRSVDMLADVVSVLKVVARDRRIDRTRVGLIGFSKGGTVATKAAMRRYIEPLTAGGERFSILIGVYPWCGDFPLDLRSTAAPLHMLLGGNDTYAAPGSCRELEKKMKALGAVVSAKVFPGAKHGWDTPGPAHWSNPRGENQSNCIYDEIAKGTWIERGSKIKVVENGKPTGDAAKALARCMTRGVSGGYDREAHSESMQDVRGLLRAAFRLN
jgi:dienelactone hydrolase